MSDLVSQDGKLVVDGGMWHVYEILSNLFSLCSSVLS